MRAVFLAIVALVLTGCFSTKRGGANPQYYTPTVIGERVWILEPGSTVVVPKPEKPARTMYMVDDVGLGMWLGIPSDRLLHK